MAKPNPEVFPGKNPNSFDEPIEGHRGAGFQPLTPSHSGIYGTEIYGLVRHLFDTDMMPEQFRPSAARILRDAETVILPDPIRISDLPKVDTVDDQAAGSFVSLVGVAICVLAAFSIGVLVGAELELAR